MFSIKYSDKEIRTRIDKGMVFWAKDEASVPEGYIILGEAKCGEETVVVVTHPNAPEAKRWDNM